MSARYVLRTENQLPPLAGWAAMDGFFVGTESAWDAHENPKEEPAAVQVTLHGVDFFDAATDRPTRTIELGDTVLEVLTEGGHTIGDYALWETRLTVPAGAAGATLTAGIGALPHLGCDWVWDRWRGARPAQPNLWVGLPVGHREAWLEVAEIVALREHPTPYPALAEQIDLDGTYIEDLASLFCALGEAFAGPGGWCASGIAGLADCLRHAPRACARPRLVWRQLGVAGRGLARKAEANGRMVTYLELVLAVLAEGSVDVVAA
jgi:hypothetical protein